MILKNINLRLNAQETGKGRKGGGGRMREAEAPSFFHLLYGGTLFRDDDFFHLYYNNDPTLLPSFHAPVIKMMVL